MPRGDRTGPMGMGARTGRKAGYCSGFGVPGYANWSSCCFGAQRRFGQGRGHRRMYRASGVMGWMFQRNAAVMGGNRY
jgi:hypothetical protein